MVIAEETRRTTFVRFFEGFSSTERGYVALVSNSRKKTSEPFVILLLNMIFIQKFMAAILVARAALHFIVKEGPYTVLACHFGLYLELVPVSIFASGKLAGNFYKMGTAKLGRLIFVFRSVVGKRRQIQQLLFKFLDIFQLLSE